VLTPPPRHFSLFSRLARASLLGLALCAALGCGESGSNAVSSTDETAAALGPDCDPIAPSHCGLPLPSSRWLVDDATTPTGKRVAFGPTTLPAWMPGKPIDAAAFADLDGFSPGMPILTHFPGATATGLVGQDEIPRSLTDDSPTVLLDADTGTRIPHWAELDESMPQDDDDRVLFLRPALRLESGKRYIAAIRHLVDATGTALTPSTAFRALRDDLPDDSIEARRASFGDVFARLAKAGVKTDDLLLAWDWTTASRERTTRRLLAMRDDALAKVGAAGPPYTITKVEENPNPHIRRRITGSMKVPLYLDHPEPGGRLVLDANGLPKQNGTTDVPFLVHVPNVLVTGAKAKMPGPIVMNAHGLLGAMTEGQDSYLATIADAMGYVAFSTPLMGMAGEDDSGFLQRTLSGDPTAFRSSVDRQHQGLLDELLVMRLMMGAFAKDPNVTFDGVSVIDPTLRFYRGDSQGGIFGGTYMAISTDVTRGLLGEPGMPYSLLFNRSVDFEGFSFLLHLVYANPIDEQIVFCLMQMLWDATEPDGYAPYIDKDLLPGTPAHEVLIHVAIGDHQVTPLGAHMVARAVGAKNVMPVNRHVWGIDEAAAPLDGTSGMVEFDFGLPTAPVINQAATDGDDPHDKVRVLGSAIRNADQFFRTGIIAQPCPGPCRPE
jgi:hypothetical protein